MSVAKAAGSAAMLRAGSNSFAKSSASSFSNLEIEMEDDDAPPPKKGICPCGGGGDVSNVYYCFLL